MDPSVGPDSCVHIWDTYRLWVGSVWAAEAKIKVEIFTVYITTQIQALKTERTVVSFIWYYCMFWWMYISNRKKNYFVFIIVLNRNVRFKWSAGATLTKQLFVMRDPPFSPVLRGFSNLKPKFKLQLYPMGPPSKPSVRDQPLSEAPLQLMTIFTESRWDGGRNQLEAEDRTADHSFKGFIQRQTRQGR